MSSNATIADIARQAGVGTATVDRVLNRRPGVNAETVQRVLQVVAELGAPPQRGRPRIGENFRFAFVLPADAAPFNELVDRLIAQAAGDFRHQHITEVTHRIDSSDAAAFAAELAQLGELRRRGPDGARPAARQARHQRAGAHRRACGDPVLRRRRLDARDPHRRRQPRRRPHRRAAARRAWPRAPVPAARDTLLLSSQATRLSGEIERRIGFAQVIEERFPKLKVQRTPDLPPGDAGACRALLRFLRSDSVDAARVAGIYNVGSGSAGVARAIESLGLTGSVGVVAHDFTDEHRALLGANGLAYVLHQDIHYCISTAARVLRALCENVRGALNVVQPRIEILTAENLH